jgi:hypothetical protein
MGGVRQQPGASTVRIRKLVLLLGVAAGVFWLVVLALPIYVLLLIGNLPARIRREPSGPS